MMTWINLILLILLIIRIKYSPGIHETLSHRIFRYFLGKNSYKLILDKGIPPRVTIICVEIVRRGEENENITKKMIEFLGPKFDFHNREFTVEDIKCMITDKEIPEDAEIVFKYKLGRKDQIKKITQNSTLSLLN